MPKKDEDEDYQVEKDDSDFEFEKDEGDYKVEEDQGDYKVESDKESSEADVKAEKQRIKAMGLENMSKQSFGRLFDGSKKPAKPVDNKSTKKPFTF